MIEEAFENTDLRDRPGHWAPELDFLLWLRSDMTEADARALVERYQQETALQLRKFIPGKGTYLPQAMRDYWDLPMCPEAILPETNVVTLFVPPTGGAA